MSHHETNSYDGLDLEQMGERPPSYVPGVRTVNIEPGVKDDRQLKLLKKGNGLTDLAEDLVEKGLYVRAKVHPGGRATLFIATTAVALGVGVAIAVRRRHKK